MILPDGILVATLRDIVWNGTPVFKADRPPSVSRCNGAMAAAASRRQHRGMTVKSDAAYKLLFSAPQIVRDLITGFVGEPWVARIDLDTLEKLPTNYVDERLRQRLTDVVWRVRTRDRKRAYLYLLIEFQSRSDHWMALRVMGYVALLWQDLVRRDDILPKPRRLPPVLPVVIYNGIKPWRAATDVEDLLPQLPEGLARHRPRMRYLLLDQNRFTREQLGSMRNLMASVMRLDRPSPYPVFLEAMADLRRLVSGSPELERLFSSWLDALFGGDPERAQAGQIDLQEREMGLRENIAMWKKEFAEEGRREGRQQGRLEGRQEGRQEGLQAGRQEGLQEGLQEGQVRLLQAQLAARFGPLPFEIRERIAAGTPEQVTNWGLRVLTARSLEDVFAN
jgi:predicted transposase YdaD